MKIFFEFVMVVSLVLLAGIANGDDLYVIEVNQPLGPEPELISGTWVFPTNPLGDLLFVYSVSIDIQHSRAADVAFGMPGLGLDFANNQGGNAILDGVYTFVEGGGAPAGTWGDGPGVYNANSWMDDPVEYRDIPWGWRVQDLASGNQGFVGDITILYDGGIIPEPSSAIVILGLGAIVCILQRR